MSSEFYIPGSYESAMAGNAMNLHLAGMDSHGVAFDEQDIYGSDGAEMVEDGPREWTREHLPQWGPPFVKFMAERLDTLEKHISDKQLQRWSFEPVTVFLIATATTSATGGLSRNSSDKAMLFEPPPGWTFALHRFSISPIGFSFAVPFNGAGGYWELRVNDEMVDGESLVALSGGSLPRVKTWGTRDAIHVRDGEVLSIFMAAGPANTNVTFKGQGTLVRKATA